MFIWILAALGSQIDPAGQIARSGRCEYPATLPAPELGEVRIICNALSIMQDGPDGRSTIGFPRRSLGVSYAFSGTMNGDELIVDRVEPSNSRRLRASGSCKTFYANDDISVVACLAKAGSQTFVANFIASRL